MAKNKPSKAKSVFKWWAICWGLFLGSILILIVATNVLVFLAGQ